MHHFRNVILVCLCLIFGSACAECSCAGCPCACWQGGYISAQVGHIWQKESARFSNANYFNTIGPLLLGSRFHFHSNGCIGGAAIGANYQDQCFVMGYEVGILSVNRKKTRPSQLFPASDTYTTRLKTLANIKVRAGLAYDRMFAYITGGWAGGATELELSDNVANIVAKKSKWVNGWVAGGGLEFKICSFLSLGAEYNYIGLCKKLRLDCARCGVGVGFGAPHVKSRHQIQTVCFRLNFHINCCCGSCG